MLSKRFPVGAEDVEGTKEIGFLGFMPISISKGLEPVVWSTLDGAIVSKVDVGRTRSQAVCLQQDDT